MSKPYPICNIVSDVVEYTEQDLYKITELPTFTTP
jgi:hypothetical protein